MHLCQIILTTLLTVLNHGNNKPLLNAKKDYFL